MIYIQQDWYSNFNAARKAGDGKLTEDMILDQIATVIRERKSDVIELLDKSGVELSEKASKKKVVKNVVLNIGNNQKLAVGMAIIIADQNKVLKPNKSSANGAPSKGKGKGWDAVQNITTQIIAVFKTQWDSANTTETKKLKKLDSERKKMLMERLNEKVGSEKGGDKKALYIGLGVLGLALAAGAVYLIIKNRRAKYNAAANLDPYGGQVPLAQPAPAPIPAPAPMPAPAPIPAPAPVMTPMPV